MKEFHARVKLTKALEDGVTAERVLSLRLAAQSEALARRIIASEVKRHWPTEQCQVLELKAIAP